MHRCRRYINNIHQCIYIHDNTGQDRGCWWTWWAGRGSAHWCHVRGSPAWDVGPSQHCQHLLLSVEALNIGKTVWKIQYYIHRTWKLSCTFHWDGNIIPVPSRHKLIIYTVCASFISMQNDIDGSSLHQWQLSIIMEHCGGGSLLDAIKVQNRLSYITAICGKNIRDLVLGILLQVCDTWN